MLVDAVPGFQIRRCPLLRNYAILQHNDLINTIYRTHSMCNDKYRLIPDQLGDEGTDLVLEYIYRHQEEFKLIFCCSAGTEYETYFDRLAAKEEYYYKQFVKQFSDGGHPIDDFFIHVYCRNGWQYVYELITHDKSYEEAKEFMANVRAFNYAGWQAVIGMKF